ncbi:uncharacterized protein LOC129610986 isoform X2 [Condylostylus longicornis]|nr:uncharacterized protein LOC129610986 isoform X2 [Condylostylus longicornis]XP_055379830.1 uncharacterized protein LOC129610986 isoform X2 [Condylostylus longicornis]
MQLLQSKTTSESVSKPMQSILTTPTTVSIKSTPLTSLQGPSNNAISTNIPIFPNAKVTSQTIINPKISSTKNSEIIPLKPGIGPARTCQQASINVTSKLFNNQTSHAKINENVIVSSIQQKQTPNSSQNKSNVIPVQYGKVQTTNSINIKQLPITSNSSIINSTLAAQTLPCAETTLSLNTGHTGISAKKILLPVGKISSNITISKAPLNSRHGPIEEPSPSISLIEKRNILATPSATVSISTAATQNSHTGIKSNTSPRINNTGSSVISSEMLNAINKDVNLHAISKLSRCNENKTLPTFSSLNNNEENITIITQFIPEQKLQNIMSDRTKMDNFLENQTVKETEHCINITNDVGSVVAAPAVVSETLSNIHLDQAQNNVQQKTEGGDEICSNITNDIKSAQNNVKSDSSADTSIKENIKLENKENKTNNVESSEILLGQTSSEMQKENSGKAGNVEKNDVDNMYPILDEIEAQSHRTPQKFVRTGSGSSKVKVAKQQSLLKNKNVEILKRSPRTLGRSKSLSCRNPIKKKSKRRLSTTSDTQVNAKKGTKDNLIDRVLELFSNSEKLSETNKTPKSSEENLNQTLLCEEQIEISPNVSGESNSSPNNNIHDASKPKVKAGMHFEQNVDFNKSNNRRNVVAAQEDLKVQSKLTSLIDNSNKEAEKTSIISNGDNPAFIEQIMSNIKPNSCAQNVAVQINELANILKWRTGIGLTKDAGMAFRINELGLLEIFEKNVNRNRLDIAYEKPIYQREMQSHKLDECTQPVYFCKGCNCHGAAVDFLAPEYCSHDCISQFEKKKMSKSSNLQQIYINQQRQKKLRKQKMSALLIDSSTSLLSSNIIPKREFSWTSYLNASNAEPAPIDLFLNPFPCGPNLFQVGMKLEAIDPEYSSLFCVCSVVEIKGYRLKIHFDGYSSTYDFWTNADSMDIFPPGWCNKTNRALQPPKYMNPATFNWSTYLMQTKTIPAPRNLFTHLNSSSNTNPFKIGVRFEADDLRNTRKVCVASVADVLDNRILVHFDGWDDRYDYWVDCNSPYIHPVNWHLQNNFEIVPPPDWKDKFDWRTYLNSINGIPATEDYFQTREPISFKVGMKLEIVDKKNPSLIRPGTVIMTDGYEIKVLFDGWSLDYSFWVVDDSPDIHPIGWCDATGHELESPPDFDSLPSILPCPVVGCRGIGNAKRFDIDFHATEDSCPYLLSNWKRELEKPERVDYTEINMKENISSQKRKHSDTCNWDISKYKKIDNSLDSFNISNQLTNNLDALSLGNVHLHRFQNRPDSNDNIFPMKKEYKSDENFQDKTVLDPKIEITKHLLCDYGPRLEQNYKLWLSYAQHITEKLDKIYKNPLQWNVDEVFKFFNKIPQCKEISEIFYKEDIDGEALLSLRQKDLTDILKIKLGTAIKVHNLIILLRAEVISRFS